MSPSGVSGDKTGAKTVNDAGGSGRRARGLITGLGSIIDGGDADVVVAAVVVVVVAVVVAVDEFVVVADDEEEEEGEVVG